MDPLASEHEGERGEDEPPIGHQVSTGETPASTITGAERSRDIFAIFKTLSRDLRRQASTAEDPDHQEDLNDEADLLDAILKTNTNDDRELATELKWTRKKLYQTRIKLKLFLKRQAKKFPELRSVLRVYGEAVEALCVKYAVLNLLLEGHFLPTRHSKSMAHIYEKYQARI